MRNKAERLKKPNIDQMVEDAVRMPIPELRKRYGYSLPFIHKILKERGITPKKRWGEMTDLNHKEGSQEGWCYVGNGVESEINVRPKYWWNY